ncbi:MAG: hypothetical protein DA330_10830, partial [Nitrososphaera sp.]|nr:hypothetical protein [Nitrososphaera sp.]
MPNENKLDTTRSKFLNTLRGLLPPQYRVLPDDRLYNVAVGLDPRISSFKFEPEPPAPLGMGEAFWQSTKEQIYRAPEIAATTYNILSENFLSSPDDPDRDEKIALRKALYESARATSQEWMESDPSLKNYQEWAQANPFSWSKFVTDPAMFGRVFSQAVTSMGTVLAAGAIGAAVGGPKIGAAAAFTVAFAQESNEAYGNAYDRAKEKGYSDAEIDRLAAESGLFYGAGSAVLETAVPLAILRSFGLGSRVAKAAAGKYAAHYLDDAIATGGKGSVDVAKRAWQEFTLSNVSMLDRITTLGRAVGLAQISEAGTEASQYLLEQAIVEGKVDGREIDLNWLQEKIQTPEFGESLAGGLVGGGAFSIPTGIHKARGVDGRQAAKIANDIGEKFGDTAKQQIIDDVLRSNDLTYIDKAEFVSLITSGNIENAVQNIKDITSTQVEQGKTLLDSGKSKPSLAQVEPTKEPSKKVKLGPTVAPGEEISTEPTVTPT